jgi:RNA polymerase sigma-70 factor (subfamily 1)
VDASDIVQETLSDAARRLDDYACERPLSFYPWLHRLAAERLVQAQRRHLGSPARGVGREGPAAFTWPGGSAALLADRLMASDTTPGHALVREEQRQRLLAALDRLATPDREILVMRYLEDQTFSGIAAILGIGQGAAKMRDLRALQRIRVLMEGRDGPEPGTMNDPLPLDLTETRDALLADLADCLRRGVTIDLVDDDGGQADELRRRPPPIRLMADLAGPAARDADLGSLGEFRIVREVGRGGMGLVYEAVQVSLGRRVALKVLLNAAALDSRRVLRFQVEAQAGASLHHPHIVPVFATGSEGGIPFYAMQFIEGRDLAQIIREVQRMEDLDVTGSYRHVPTRSTPRADRLLSDRAAARLGLQAAEALAYAHAHDVLHRDIKPSNLLVDATGHLWVTDFGLARIRGELDLTRTGDRLGTPRFMSPEQAGGRTPIDGRTDVYALGMTLYELLTLRPAFDDEDQVKLLRRIAEDEPTRPRRIDPRIAAELETIVLKAMAKDPADRYTTAAELAEDLRRFLADRPILARRPTLARCAVKWARRHRSLVAVGLAGLVLLTFGAAVGAWRYTTWLYEYNTALQAQKARADQSAREADRQRRLAERRYLAAQVALAQRAIEAGEFRRAREVLGTVRHIADPSDPREFAWRAVWRAAHRVITIGEQDGRQAYGVTASPDGTTLASLDPTRPAVDLRDRATGRPRGTLAAPGLISPFVPLQFSPDGGRLVAGPASGEPRYWIWDISRSGRFTEFEPPIDPPVARVFLLVGGRFCTIHRGVDGSPAKVALWKLDPDSSPEPQRVAALSETALYESYSPDGRTVVVRDPGRLRFFDALDGTLRLELTQNLSSTSRPVRWARFAEDGRTLIELSATSVSCFDTPTGESPSFQIDQDWSPDQISSYIPKSGTLVLTDPAKGTVTLRSMGGLPSTKRLASIPTSETRVISYLVEPGKVASCTHEALSLTIRPELPEGPPEIGCYVSPDGSMLAVTARVVNRPFQPVTLWDPVTGGKIATCPESHSSLSAVSFTPDSRGLILQHGDQAALWRLDDPEAVAGHSDEAWAAAFSPDGKVLATGSDDTDEPKTIKLWDPSTGRLVRAWSGGVGTVAALAFSPDGRVLASAHLEEEENVRLWDVATGQPLGTLSGHTGRARTVVFAPDGATLATAASDGTVRLWDVASQRCVRQLTGSNGGVEEVAYAPDGMTLAAAGSDGLRLWDVATGQARSFRADKGLMTVAFAPGGATLAAADRAGRVLIYDATSGVRRMILPVGVAELNALAFAPDGSFLAVAGRSGTIHVVDPRTGDAWPGLEVSSTQVNGLAFSPAGSILASCSHDGAVRLWRAGAGFGPTPN